MTMDNATITKAEVLVEDHGYLTLLVSFEGAGMRGSLPLQTMGGSRTAPRLGVHVKALLSAFNNSYDGLSSLKGLPCRVQSEDGMFTAVGHFMEDRWYVPADVNAKHEHLMDG